MGDCLRDIASDPADERPRLVVEGQDIPADASLRVARAEQHFTDLEARVALWNVANPLICPVQLSDDRKLIRFLRPGLAQFPPLMEWTAILGDAIHNLRAALDVLCWHFAHLDGGQPANPRSIAFPVVSEEAKWASAASKLSTIPTELLDRIKDAQPFMQSDRNPDKGLHVLEALTELDNWHKHRFTLSSTTALGGLDLDGFAIKIPPVEEHYGGASVQFSKDILALADGDPVATMSWGFRIGEDSQVPTSARIATVPSVPQGDFALNVYDLHSFLHDNVRNMLSVILRGHKERTQISSMPAPDDWAPPADTSTTLELEYDK